MIAATSKQASATLDSIPSVANRTNRAVESIQTVGYTREDLGSLKHLGRNWKLSYVMPCLRVHGSGTPDTQASVLQHPCRPRWSTFRARRTTLKLRG